MIAVVAENVQHFPAQLMENARHSPGRQQYHREAFFQASYSKERGCTSKTRRRISRKQRRQFMESLINEMFERIAEMSSVRSIETKCSQYTRVKKHQRHRCSCSVSTSNGIQQKQLNARKVKQCGIQSI